MSSPAPKSPETDKSRKYDRQIRLWGEQGQALLEAAKVCLINATATGCEVLKSLVLPGIGGFTIVDCGVVSEVDVGINFFLDATYIGKSKASACMKLLQEMNPDVNGDYVDESIDFILTNTPNFFDTFNVVVASNLNEQTLLQLSNCLWNANVPFIYCRSIGFYGSIRLQIKEHCVIEAHPDNRQYDLRLEQPFPDLKQHLESSIVTSKVPWLLVLNKYLDIWKNEHNGHIPANYKEKSQLREMIRDAIKNDEENYEEAIKAVNTAFGGGVVSTNLKAILSDESAVQLTKQSDPFWIMVKALKDFIENDNNGLLPLAGILPDMTADTESYISLQNVYRKQALKDADNVYQKCQRYLLELNLPEDTITEKSVRLFCREASGLCVVRGSKMSEEYEKRSSIASLVAESEGEGNLTEIYVALCAYERFLTECGNIPGECYIENDTARFKTIANKMLTDWGANCFLSDDLIHELCRYGGAEVHSISAFIGGCVAQEVIKIITKQYKPNDNTFMYNGISSETAILKL